MNTTTPVTTPEGQHVTVWTEPRPGYPGVFTVRTTQEGGALFRRAGLIQFCHVRGAEKAIAEHEHQVALAQGPDNMPDQYDFATAYEQDGTEYDRLANFDTAIQYANDGYKVTIHKDSSLYTREQMQEAVNAELAAALDCFGEDYQK